MANKNDTVTFKELYTFVDEKIKEVNGGVRRIEEQVDNIGKSVANIEGRLMLIPAIITIAFNLIFIVIQKFIK